MSLAACSLNVNPSCLQQKDSPTSAPTSAEFSSVKIVHKFAEMIRCRWLSDSNMDL